jgi:hypothetical protein
VFEAASLRRVVFILGFQVSFFFCVLCYFCCCKVESIIIQEGNMNFFNFGYVGWRVLHISELSEK